jgi:uncharacterized protein (TIGR00369 family)
MSEPAVPHVTLRKTLTGLEFFRRIADGTVAPPPMVALLGLTIVEVAEGRIAVTGTPTEQFYNGLGVAHGGWTATLLDTALGCAVNSTQPAGRVMTTLELKINYTRPLTREVGEVRCDAAVVHVGSRTATAEARVTDRSGAIYAHGTTTCIVI